MFAAYGFSIDAYDDLLPNKDLCVTLAIGKLDKLSVFGNDYDTKDRTGVMDYIHAVDLAHVAA